MFLLIQQATKVRLSGKLTLHSNMFLLIHRPARWSCTANDFTFQYVSINTEKTCTLGWAQNYFTFQYVSINTCSSISRSASASNFTFQYVSINTISQILEISCSIIFTFQYVSINTEQRYDEQQAEIDLYIPICFY